MIIEMPNTKTSAIARKITELHEERGEAGNDRVLTLIIATDESGIEDSLKVANSVSREHPCRVIAVVPRSDAPQTVSEGTVETVFVGSNDKPECISVDSQAEGATDLDAQVRFGSDAGAGEIVILRPSRELMSHADTLVIPLLVPDIPVVTWWPTNPPADPSADPLGAMSLRRITDALRSKDSEATIKTLWSNWNSKDVDLSWTRLTEWRAMLASMLDQPPHLPITAVKVTGQADYLPLDLLVSWLEQCLNVPVEVKKDADATAVTGVYLTRSDGVVSLVRSGDSVGTISQPGQTPQPVTLPLRTLEDCLAEELRRTDSDEVYAQVVSAGLNS